MNLYFLVEGRRTEKKVYRAWLSYVFPYLHEVDRIEDIYTDHYFMLAGNGYPSYRQRIIEALQNILRHKTVDHFFICIDTEQETVETKVKEIQGIISEGGNFANTHIIAQNCCIETWFLGNQRMMKRNPHNEQLRAYKNFYDVSTNDPEYMGCFPSYEVRAHFHEAYLKAMLQERGLSYTKSRPDNVIEQHYFEALVTRNIQTGHIQTFGILIDLWKKMGGII